MLAFIAWISIVLALGCATWIAIDELRHPQSMAIMNFVWPLTALYFSFFALWAYYRVGRQKTKQAMSHQSNAMAHHDPNLKQITPTQVAIATSHCGAGCALADLISEFAIAAAGLTLLGSTLWADYAIDFTAAWTLGVIFQYFSIKPMRKLSAGAALLAAIKADTLSILAFQIGMYAWMAVVFLFLFARPHLAPMQPQYWHDADRDDRRVRHIIPNESVADHAQPQGGNVDASQ